MVINNGICLQFGAGYAGNTNKTVTFPTSFTSNTYKVMLTRYWFGNTENSIVTANAGGSKTLSSCAIYTNTAGSHSIAYLVIGY